MIHRYDSIRFLLSNILETHGNHLKQKWIEWHSFYFYYFCYLNIFLGERNNNKKKKLTRRGELIEIDVIIFRVKSKANARSCAASSALALLRTGSTYPEFLKSLHFIFWIVRDLFHFARVDYEAETVDCDRCLSYVRWENTFSYTVFAVMNFLFNRFK